MNRCHSACKEGKPQRQDQSHARRSMSQQTNAMSKTIVQRRPSLTTCRSLHRLTWYTKVAVEGIPRSIKAKALTAGSMKERSVVTIATVMTNFLNSVL